MIGDARTRIVTGYEWLTQECESALAKHIGNQKGQGTSAQKPNPNEIAKRLQNAIAGVLISLRKFERGQKEALELKKNTYMQKPDDIPSKATPHDYLFKEYVPTLRQIGISIEKLSNNAAQFSGPVNTIFQNIHGGERQITVVENTLRVELKQKRQGAWGPPPATEATIPIVKFLVGVEGFQVKNTTTPRHVYAKRTISHKEFKKGPNEYVKDDAGFMTRRYAYAEKSREAINGLVLGHFSAMKGRFIRANEQRMRGPVTIIHSGKEYKQTYVADEDYQDDSQKQNKVLGAYSKLIANPNVTAHEKAGFIEISDKEGKPLIIHGYKRYIHTSGPSSYALPQGATMTTQEMLFINQELGSGPHQRGICLASTPKMIHGNKGEPFRSNDTVLVEVDLAQVPIGRELLFNLYSKEAQATTIGLSEMRDNSQRNEETMREHTNTSTAKNREIFLLELKKEYLAHISADLHRQAWKNVEEYKQSLK